MLDSIKNMIKKQNAYMEAANFIFEDASGRNLDEEIVLGRHNSFMEAEEEFDSTDISSNDTETGDVENENPPVEEEPIDDTSIDENEPEAITPEDVSEDSIDPPDEEPVPIPGDDLPTPDPVADQTTEPVSDEDLVSVDVDLQSNTIKDILPVPPSNAAEAIEGDSLETHVDAGFSGEVPEGEVPGDGTTTELPVDGETTPAVEVPADGEPTPVEGAEGENPPLDETTPDPETLSEPATDIGDESIEDEPLSEAITLGGDTAAAPAAGTDPNAVPDTNSDPLTAAGAAADAAGVNGDTNAPADGQENAVTAAVRDKVSDSGTDFSMAGDDFGMDSGVSGDGAANMFKKLSAMSKSLEDLKADLFNNKM